MGTGHGLGQWEKPNSIDRERCGGFVSKPLIMVAMAHFPSQVRRKVYGEQGAVEIESPWMRTWIDSGLGMELRANLAPEQGNNGEQEAREGEDARL